MFCAMNLTVMNSGTAVSLSQCNLLGYSISIDKKQDLTEVTYDISNGRMKVEAHRKLNTGDCTDLILAADTPYYVIMAMGKANDLTVGRHGPSSTHNMVCLSTLEEKFECKPPDEWENKAPTIPSSTSDASMLGWLTGLALSLISLQ